MKKILLIHLFNDRSGSPKVLSEVIKSLKKNGYETELLTSSHSDGFLTGCADINKALFYKRSENKLLTLFYYIISQTFLFFQCLRYWNQDVVFYINTMMPFGAALSGKLMGKKIIYHVHETSIKPKLLKDFLRLIIQLTATKIIFVSDFLRKQESFKNIHQTVIYNAIDSDFFETAERITKHTNSKNFNVLMISSLKKYKGIFEFLKIAHLCSNNKKISFTLVLNANKEEISTYLHETKIPDNVSIHSRQSNVKPFYQSSNLLLNLSRPDEWIETFGLTIIEAMAYGLPSIVPPVGGPAEIVRDEIDGYLISAYHIEAISDKIQLLSSDEVLYHSLSKNVKLKATQYDIKVFEENIHTTVMELN